MVESGSGTLGAIGTKTTFASTICFDDVCPVRSENGCARRRTTGITKGTLFVMRIQLEVESIGPDRPIGETLKTLASKGRKSKFGKGSAGTMDTMYSLDGGNAGKRVVAAKKGVIVSRIPEG
jgi:hypothetical protein